MVESTVYVVHGWVLPFDLKSKDGSFDGFRDDLLPYTEGWGDAKYLLVSDQMSGDYRVFGICLARESIPNDFKARQLRQISNEEIQELKDEFNRIFAGYIPVMGTYVPPAEPSTFMFVHYS